MALFIHTVVLAGLCALLLWLLVIEPSRKLEAELSCYQQGFNAVTHDGNGDYYCYNEE